MPDPEDHEDDTMPPQSTAAPTETFPRVSRDEATRLDARNLFEVGEPTVATDRNETLRQRPLTVRVSPPRAHTVGAAAETPPEGVRTVVALPEVATLNQLLDERERARDRKAGRAAASAAHTVREEARRRATAKLRHERHLEVIETVRAYMVLTIIFALLVIVVGAGIVGYGIIAGFFEWRPTRV